MRKIHKVSIVGTGALGLLYGGHIDFACCLDI